MITSVYACLSALKAEDGELHASEEKSRNSSCLVIPTVLHIRNGSAVDKSKDSDVEGPDFVS